MNKGNNKKILTMAAVAVIILIIAGIFSMKNKPNSPEGNTAESITITATVREAAFGSVVNVSLSEAAKKEYAGATSYQVYYEKGPITQKEVLGTPTTAFPARKEGDTVTIKLLKEDGSDVHSADLKLQKENTAK